MARRVLVTGGTSGIGKATVERLVPEWDVLATARRPDDLARLDAIGATPIQLDLTDQTSLQQAAEDVGIDTPLDGLVHNAGIGIPGAVEDLSPDAWRQQFGVNVLGPIELTRQLSPALRAAEGRIVLVSSQAAITHLPLYGAYCASKAALEVVGDTLRTELRPAGVRVSMVQPGPVETNFQARSRELLETHVDVEASPHQRAYERVDQALLDAVGEVPVEDVAQAIERGLTARWPPARIPVGRLPWLGAKAAAWMPAWLQDRVLRWFFRL